MHPATSGQRPTAAVAMPFTDPCILLIIMFRLITAKAAFRRIQHSARWRASVPASLRAKVIQSLDIQTCIYTHMYI